MKTFDEEFPSTKMKRYSCSANFENGGWDLDKEGDWMNIAQVQECCLDKQRVQEAFDDVLSGHVRERWCPVCDGACELRAVFDLKKRLGLEKDVVTVKEPCDDPECQGRHAMMGPPMHRVCLKLTPEQLTELANMKKKIDAELGGETIR